MPTYQDLIRLIQTGDDVSEGTINTILRQLDGNNDYLKALLEAALLGSTVFARGVTIETDALVGQPVYYRPSTQQFERAIASAESDPTTGILNVTESTYVWGVVYSKLNSTKADILLTGYAELDLVNAVDGTIDAGLYFLSGTEAGKLQQSEPPIRVPILQATDDGRVHVRPNFSDLLTAHQHYKFQLVSLPSGTHSDPGGGGHHTIGSPDSAVEGWLPAGDAIFNGLAPAGAHFGYNLSASLVNNVWPPIPVSGAYLDWNRGFDVDQLLQGVPANLCIIDNNGIWWMSDCYDEVPWPSDLDTSLPTSTTTTPAADACYAAVMEMFVHFSKMKFQTSGTVVQSLRGSGDGIITVRCVLDDTEAATGHLYLDLDLAFMVDPDDDEAGYLVFKTLTDNTFARGPVVSSLVSSSSGVVLSGTLIDGKYYGDVSLNILAQVVGVDIAVATVRLDNATEEYYKNTMGLGFPNGRDSEIRGEFRIPTTIDGIDTVSVQIRAWFMLRAAGDVPAFTMTYRELLRPDPLTTGLPLVVSDSALVFDTSVATGLSEDEYVEISSANIIATPGSVIQFTLARAGATDGFAAEVHMIKNYVSIISAVETP
jgi:hypothetical protein